MSLTLSRPLAKVGVWAANDAEEGTDPGVTVTSVTLMNVPDAGTLLPAAGADAEDRGTVQVQALAGPVRVTAFLDREDPDFQQHRQDPDCYTPVAGDAYIPENPLGQDPDGGYDWTDGAAQGATFVRIKYISNNNNNTGNDTGNGTDDPTQNEKTADVYLPKIIRNTQYKLLCNIKNNHIANVIVVVNPWNNAEEQIIHFTDNVSLTGSPEWTGNMTQEGSVITYNGSGADNTAACTFTIDTPKGGMWYATLEGGDLQNFSFADGTRTMSGPIVPETPVTLTVKTLENNQFKGEKKIHLRLTAVTADGKTLSVKVGSNDAYYTLVQPEN